MALGVALIAAASGMLVGALADRLAARWPSHADGHARSLDWRSIVVLICGVAAFVALFERYADPRDQIVMSVYFAALIVLLATDLDQKLLPDLVTLPLIGFAAFVVVLRLDPMLEGKDLGMLSAVVAGIGAPILLLLTSFLFGGGIGMGDIKLAVSLGLLSGITRFLAGFLVASVASAAIVLILLAARRIELRSAIPFGPILIAAGIVAALLP